VRKRWALRAFVAAEVLLVLALCLASAVRVPVFANGDEGYHLSYAVHVAEGRGLPVVGQTPVHPEVLALQDGVYPARSTAQAADLGFRGESYEAFQPPLYYALAAPFSAWSDDWQVKVRLLRLLAVALLLPTFALLYVLCRLVRPSGPLPVYAAALVPLLFPAFRQQQMVVGNDVLLVPLTIGFACCAWLAATRRSVAAQLGAGVLVGLLLLTKLTAVWSLVVLVLIGLAVVRAQPTLRARALAVLVTGVPALMLLPWLASNLQRYGALTANELVLRLQAEVSPPTRPTAAEEAWQVVVVLVQLVLGRRDDYASWVTWAAGVLAVGLLLANLVVLVGRVCPWPVAVVLALPLPLQIALLSVLSVVQGTELLYERYLLPVAPLAALAAVLLAARLPLRSRRPREDEQVVEPQLEGPVAR